MDAAPIFIVGCDRSGTTLLRLMLTQNPVLHIPQESGFLHRLREHADLYGDFSHPRQRWFFIRDLQTNPATSKTKTFPVFELTPEEAETALRRAAPTTYADASAALFAASARKRGKMRWGDKTPGYVMHIDWLAEAFPAAQFIHIIRDGRDVASSMKRAGWQTNIYHGVRYWKKRVSAGRRAGQALRPGRYYELHYEDLVTSPRETLRTLCSWIDLDYTSSLLTYHETSNTRIPDEHADLFELIDQPVDPSRAFAWKRSMSKREIADAEDVAGNLFETLGYDVVGVRPPFWVRGLRAVHRATPPILPTLRRLTERIV